MMSFVMFRAFWTAEIASIITHIMGWWALANVSQKLYGDRNVTNNAFNLDDFQGI